MLPRSAATWLMALLMSASAVCAQAVVGEADAVHVVAVELPQSGRDGAAAGRGGIAQEHVHGAGVGGVVESPTGGASNIEAAGSGVGCKLIGCRSAAVLGVGNDQMPVGVQRGDQPRAGTVDVVDHSAHRGIGRLGGVNGSAASGLDGQRSTGCRGQPGCGGSIVPNDLVEVGSAAGEDGRTVVGGVGADAVNFGLDRSELRIQRLALG